MQDSSRAHLGAPSDDATGVRPVANGALKRATIHPEAEERTTVSYDAREHTQVWTALRDREAKLRAQAAEHAGQFHTTTAGLLAKSADICRKLTDDLDAARDSRG